jgi:cell division protein FtsI/penicillin-binding protein 2
MSPVPNMESASGLRPASAFVLIAIVLAVAAATVAHVAIGQNVKPRSYVQRDLDPDPEYTITDREGRPMALFVQRLDVVLSPNALWQAHTPDTLATAVAQVLGQDPNALLARMLPDADARGVITARFTLDQGQASRIDRWLACGSAEGEGAEPPVQGLWIERDAHAQCWRLRWHPVGALCEASRAAHGKKFESNPMRWSRWIADGLAQCLMGPDALAIGDDEQTLEAQRAAVWADLMPSTWCVAVRGFDAPRAPELLELLNNEHVAWHQMRIARDRDRHYPAGQIALLGSWGFIEREEAQRRALLELGFDAQRLGDAAQRRSCAAELTPDERRVFGALTWQYLASPLPLSGLERASDSLLGNSAQWDFLDDWQAEYTFRRDRSVRGKSTRAYFLSSKEASETPRVCTTFDALLQRQVGTLLDDLMKEHRPAVAMAIAVELATGDVLAVDARSQYEISGFAPLFHEFTPGSTMKVPVMACALESGAVTPTTPFDVGFTRHYQLGSRTITEAESSRTGHLTATECLAWSVNAGMVQVGLRVPAEFMHEKFLALHYGERPHSDLGGERAGLVPPLPWSREWTHASVSFGYELKMTLWQHAAALAAVVRGGEWLPLRIVDAVEQNGERYTLPRAQPERVFSPETCAQVRAMMQLGAREGTGKPVASPEKLPGLIVGTKTGTAQKTPSEICIHEELAHQAKHRRDGTKCSQSCRASLRGRREGHANCYTSSMCIWGSLEGTQREVMVLVVADEPRGNKGHFGSQVAGPTAVAILKEALGRTHLGDPTVPDVVAGFAPSAIKSARTPDQPWAEVNW